MIKDRCNWNNGAQYLSISTTKQNVECVKAIAINANDYWILDG